MLSYRFTMFGDLQENRARLLRGARTSAVLLFTTLVLISSADAQTDSGNSLGSQLVTAVVDADVAKTRTFLAAWRRTGKAWPTGPEEKPLLFLAIEGREEAHPEIIDLLLENGAQVATRGPEGMTALHWAAANGYPERTAQILKRRPALEATDDYGRTALLVAHGDAAEKLLAAGANIRATDKDGMTGLHYAAQTGAAHLGLLFDAGLKDVDARSKAGLTPLHVAAVEGNESAARWLLDRGAKADATLTADFDYLPYKMAPGYGNEMRLKRGSTPLRLASLQHGSTKWSSGRHRAVLELLKARTPKRWFSR